LITGHPLKITHIESTLQTLKLNKQRKTDEDNTDNSLVIRNNRLTISLAKLCCLTINLVCKIGLVILSDEIFQSKHNRKQVNVILATFSTQY
jgi:hypothetical protein